MQQNLTLKAGSRALEIIQDEGLRSDRIKILAGASGGPKWLVLSGMDLVLADIFKTRQTPLYCIGSSIGSWRFAALAQENPQAAIRAFEEAYIHQQYDGKPSIKEVSQESHRIMQCYIPDDRIEQILNHSKMKLAFISVRSNGLGGSDHPLLLAMHFAGAALGNLVQRKYLSCFFERALFCSPGFDQSLLQEDAFTSYWVEMNPLNFRDALLASGSIPLVMEGIADIDDAPSGTYRDGGVIDYHMNLAYQVAEDEIVLMPHFFEHLVPGWFDQQLFLRKPDSKFLTNMVMIAPKAEFVAALPGKKVPDRDDFKLFFQDDPARFARWEKVVDDCRVLGDELGDLFNRRTLAAEPLEA